MLILHQLLVSSGPPPWRTGDGEVISATADGETVSPGLEGQTWQG